MPLTPDVRVAFRSLARTPGFTAAVVCTLALGIAANATVFTFVNAVLLRPLPFEQPRQVLDLGSANYLDVQDWRRSVRTLSDVAALRGATMNVVDVDGAVERYRGAYVSANAFALIGRGSILGRSLSEADERPGAQAVALIGHDVWRTRYGSDPGIVGRQIRVNGRPATIVGVMPEAFAFPQIAKLWLPLSLSPELQRDPSQAAFETFGRMRSDATMAQVKEELTAIQARLVRDYPARERREPSPVAEYRGGVGADTPVSVAFMLMMGAVGFVLLIACANVANLMLVRASARARDASIRQSLGASRWNVIRPLLNEALVLAAAAGITGLALSRGAVALTAAEIARTGDAPYWLDFTLDLRSYVFVTAACLATAMFAGLAPAWVSSARRISEALNEAGRTAAGGTRQQRWTNTFVVAQLALSLMLLAGAGAMIRSVVAQMQANAGIDRSNLVTARLELAPPAYRTPDDRRRFYSALEERFASSPDLPTAFARQVPLGEIGDGRLVTDLNPDAPAAQRPQIGRMVVSANYFSVLGAPVGRGRMFQAGEREPVTVINQRLADAYFPGIDPVGHRIRITPRRETPEAIALWFTIIGVVRNVRQEAREGGDFDPIAYVPYAQEPDSTTFAIVRSGLPPATVASVLRERLRAIDPDVPPFDIRTLDDRLAYNQWGQRFAGTLFAIFAVVALVLAGVGLYAVTAYATAARTREIGIRMALGAARAHVASLVLRRVGVQLGVGTVLGLAAGVAVTIALPAQLTGVSGSSPGTFAGVTALLLLVGLAAAVVPARRAVRLDPVAALRAE